LAASVPNGDRTRFVSASRRRATVLGAGLAGLSAATLLTERGFAVELVDSAPQAGGRCRSYRDPQLGLVIDNGNHLVLSGNDAVMRYRRRIGADGGGGRGAGGGYLAGPPHADYAFADLGTGARWTVQVNDGRVPWWVLDKARRVPGSTPRDYLPLARLLRAQSGRVRDHVPVIGPVWTRLIEPVLLAALNTAPADASARLVANVLRGSVGRGGRAMRPLIAEPTLAAAFVEPALAMLRDRGAEVRTGRKLRALRLDEGQAGGARVSGLDWGDGVADVAPGDVVIVATPAWIAQELVPGLDVPGEHRAILNAHFACPPPATAPRMLGLLGATAEWVFAFPDRISVTISGADRLIDREREGLAGELWRDICAAYGIDAPLPRWQIVKEKRATFAATPEQDARRPHAATRWQGLFLAGDWTQTGLPSTIEGALRSGEIAADLASATV
jgi:squalene-associated FAD-dependent desaturase